MFYFYTPSIIAILPLAVIITFPAIFIGNIDQKIILSIVASIIIILFLQLAIFQYRKGLAKKDYKREKDRKYFGTWHFLGSLIEMMNQNMSIILFLVVIFTVNTLGLENLKSGYHMHQIVQLIHYFNTIKLIIRQMIPAASVLTKIPVIYNRIAKILVLDCFEKTPIVFHENFEKGDLVISMNNLKTKYLSDINLNIFRGDVVAVIGEKNSGKSQFLQVLGNLPLIHNGNISFHSKISDGEAFIKYAYIEQNPWILHGNLEKNLFLGAENHLQKHLKDDNQKVFLIEQSLKFAELIFSYEFLSNITDLANDIHCQNENFLTIQKKKICLARIFTAINKNMFLIDEPLEGLEDFPNEAAKILDNIIQFSKQPNYKNHCKTTVIAFNENCAPLLKNVDYIVVLKNGEISEIGNYQQLMNLSSDFADMVLEYQGNFESNPNVGDKNTVSLSNFSAISTDSENELADIAVLSKNNAADLEAQSNDQSEKTVRLSINLPKIKTTLMDLIGQMPADFYITRKQLKEWQRKRRLYLGAVALFLIICDQLLFLAIFAKISSILYNNQHLDRTDNQRELLKLAILILLKLSSTSIITSTICPLHSATIEKTKKKKFKLKNMGKFDPSISDMKILKKKFPTATILLMTLLVKSLFGMTTTLFTVNVKVFTICLLISLILGIYLFKFTQKAQKNLQEIKYEVQNKVNYHLEDTLYGLLTIRAYNIGRNYVKRLSDLYDEVLLCDYLKRGINSFLNYYVSLIGDMYFGLIVGYYTYCLVVRSDSEGNNGGDTFDISAFCFVILCNVSLSSELLLMGRKWLQIDQFQLVFRDFFKIN